MTDIPPAPAPAPATAPAPQPAPAPAVPLAPPVTGEQLVSVKGLRLALDPGDAWPLGHPAGAELAPVPPDAVIKGAA